MDLITVWFVLIAILWTGYLVLEGFDFGVGMLLPVLSRGESPQDTSERKRLMLTTIGPFWDGNEVWLLTAGGAMFAAFPGWYASMFSAMYLPFVLLLVALILRNVGLEYRHKRTDEEWTTRWDWAIIGGSLAAPFLVGVALTNLVHGLPLNADHQFTGTVFTLLNPISLLGGLAVVALCLTHACFFLALKTEGPIRGDARALAGRIGPVAAVLGVVLLLWLGIERGTTASWISSAIAAAGLVFALLANAKDAEGRAFAGTALSFVGIVAAYFLMLWPIAIPSTLNPAWSLTAAEAASSPGTLRIMTWATVIFLPIVLMYTAWSYWVFRRRLSTHQLAATH